jgi:hypothetical protein
LFREAVQKNLEALLSGKHDESIALLRQLGEMNLLIRFRDGEVEQKVALTVAGTN